MEVHLMLTIKQLTIKDLKNHILLEGFNYSLGNNDKVAIIGEEGNGKSTLLKAIYSKQLIENYTVISGTIDTDFKQIGYFEQQLSSIWDKEYVYAYVLKEIPGDEIAIEQYNDLQYYETLCAKLKLDVNILREDRLISSLSGGEKVKIQLLKILGKNIDLLLLDEPTNDLDIETLDWLEGFINSLSIPVIFISHDETLLMNSATVLIHLEQVNKKSKARYTIFRGNYNDYVTQRYAKLEKDVQIAKKEKDEYMKKKIKLNDFQNAVHDALNDTVRNPGQAAKLAKKMTNIKAMDKRFDREGYSKVDSVEEAIDVYFEDRSLHSAKQILDVHIDELTIANHLLVSDIHLHLHAQDKVVITGNNGCGKSILMKQLYAYLLKKNDIVLGYMPQSYQDLFLEDETPVSFLLEEGDQADVTNARELLGRMKFTSEEMIHHVRHLSEGQKAKLYLLKFIKRGCNVILLDEPTRNLSPLTNPVIRGILKDFKGCMIAISHDRKFIEEVCSEHYEIKNQTWIHRREKGRKIHA